MHANPVSTFMQGEEAYSKKPEKTEKNQKQTMTFASAELFFKFNKWRKTSVLF